MNRHTQLYGVRHYFGDDLIELQNEPLKAIDAIFQQYGPCVVHGCNVTPGTAGKYNIGAGVVALGGGDHPIMVMPFAGATRVSLPVYMTSGVEIRSRAYDDGNVKPIAYNYSARLTATKPTGTGAHIEITESSVPRFVDVIQDTTHRFITDIERIGWNKIGTTMASNLTKGLMSSADKVKLDGVAQGANKYVHPNDATSRHVSDTEKQTWNSKASTTTVTTSANGLMAAADKAKLDGVAQGANKYVHPTDAASRHVSDSEKQTWDSKASTATVTTSANGLMAAADKAKLDGVAQGANKYTHPTDSSSLHMTQQERSKLTMLDNGVKFPIAGYVSAPDGVGPIPSSKLTILKGNFSAEMFNVSSTGINVYYRITHNLNTLKYHPMVNIECGEPVLADTMIKRIEPNYFEVIISTPASGDSLDATGVFHSFRFTIIQFI